MRNFYYTISLSVLFSFLFAQKKWTNSNEFKIEGYSQITHLPMHVSFDRSKRMSKLSFSDWMKQKLVSQEDVSFALVDEVKTDPLGYTHSRLQQYYKGYKIEGADLRLHAKNDEVESFNGEWYDVVDVSNSIILSEKQALQYALQKVKAKKYKWHNKAETAHMQAVLNNPNFNYSPIGELCIFPLVDASDKLQKFSFAYKFNIYAEEPLYRANVYVDATTGTILAEQSTLCHFDEVGVANTKYSGTQSITTDNYGQGYRLRESGRGLGIETYNLSNGTNYGSVSDFTNSVNTWTTTNNDQAATDAHFGAEATYDYFKQQHQRNSLDGNGYKLLSYVHYGTSFANAFWDGQRMTYGDGSSASGLSIMTALDVCGHEITHGVIERTANLYKNSEAGAINESFADIFGTCVEWFARPTQHDWIMGKDITINGLGMRNMSNPNQFSHPDTYKGTFWSNTAVVSTNSGPCNYWFYLLCEGGSGTNDISQAYTITPITMQKAASIAYRALTVYMTASTDYANLRNYTIQAAKDLYGECSNEVVQTTNAWYAVGVGNTYPAANNGTDFTAYQLSSCSLPAQIYFENKTIAGQSYKWDFGDGTVGISNLNPTHTYTANGTYSVKLVSIGCGVSAKDSVIKSDYISINAPSAPLVSDAFVCSGLPATFSATASGSIAWYDALTPMNNLLGIGTPFVTPTLTTNTTYYAITTSTFSSIYGGPANNTIFGGGSNFNTNAEKYLIFDVYQPCYLKSVLVYAGSAGNRIIELRDSKSNAIQSATVAIAAGTQTVNLNFKLSPGSNYRLGVNGSTINMFRNNSGSGYPYDIGGIVSIKSSDVGNNYYFFFYNWQIQQDNCQSLPSAVTANVSVCSGVDEQDLNSSIKMFPNPAREELEIELANNLEALGMVEIYDTMGKLVMKQTIHSSHIFLDVANLSSGVYTCFVLVGENTRVVKRFVKE